MHTVHFFQKLRFFLLFFHFFRRTPHPPDTPPPDCPKFRAFFFHSPATIFALFLSLTGGLFVEFWWWFLKAGTANVHVWALQTCTFAGPCASNTTKIPREDPPEREKKSENGSGKGEKSATFFAPTLQAQPLGP